MADFKIYHNPRCGKSRNTLALINDKGVQVEIVEYLKEPLSRSELESIIGKLGIKPIDLIRKGESVFKSDFKGKDLSDSEWIDAMVTNPILIERPIVVKGDKAIIGRPPENVLTLF